MHLLQGWYCGSWVAARRYWHKMVLCITCLGFWKIQRKNVEMVVLRLLLNSLWSICVSVQVQHIKITVIEIGFVSGCVVSWCPYFGKIIFWNRIFSHIFSSVLKDRKCPFRIAICILINGSISISESIVLSRVSKVNSISGIEMTTCIKLIKTNRLSSHCQITIFIHISIFQWTQITKLIVLIFNICTIFHWRIIVLRSIYIRQSYIAFICCGLLFGKFKTSKFWRWSFNFNNLPFLSNFYSFS